VSDKHTSHSECCDVGNPGEYPVVAVLSGWEITWYTATDAPDPVTG